MKIDVKRLHWNSLADFGYRFEFRRANELLVDEPRTFVMGVKRLAIQLEEIGYAPSTALDFDHLAIEVVGYWGGYRIEFQYFLRALF